MESTRLIAAVASGFMLLAALSPPFLQYAGMGSLTGYAYHVFSRVCHQIPSRSPALLGGMVAVCFRCLGIYAGLFLGCLFYRQPASGGMPKPHLLLAAAFPMAADVLLESLGIYQGSNWLRLATGLVFGLIIPFYLIPSADKAGNRLMLFIRNPT